MAMRIGRLGLRAGLEVLGCRARGTRTSSLRGQGGDLPTVSRILVVDFDETCTVGDTISHIVSATMASKPPLVVRGKEALYQKLLKEYIEERESLMTNIMGEESCESLNSSSRAWLTAFLDSMSEFEIRRNDAVLESKLLHGASRQSLIDASKMVTFRQGCVETLRRASSDDGRMNVAVLSANWSAEFIRAAFERNGLSLENLSIISNSLEFDSTDSTTGALAVRICQSPNDKDRLLRALSGPYEKTVYVGDSVGDIPALLGAHVGIVIGYNELLRRVLERGGVEVRDIGDLMSRGTRWWEHDEASPVVYCTNSWEDIRCILW
jgi:2-hydroxy-3-keto-5-methylthiopentenyl-1-phosphate phosphatase